jgi:hypothetical protein
MRPDIDIESDRPFLRDYDVVVFGSYASRTMNTDRAV